MYCLSNVYNYNIKSMCTNKTSSIILMYFMKDFFMQYSSAYWFELCTLQVFRQSVKILIWLSGLGC